MELLQIENLSFRYPDAKHRAVSDISASVNSGEFILLCGESGCGKTTLLRLLKKELAPFGETQGTIRYLGQPLSKISASVSAAEIGFVMQHPEQQIITDTVWQELAFGLENLGLPTPVIRRRVAEMASYFGIGELFHKKTSELSGGQKQLVNLASVMVMQPKLLLLDEPTAQLDPIAAADFIATLQKLNRELGLTILLIEHRLEEVLPIADRVWLMEHGRLLLDDLPRRIGPALSAQNGRHPMLSALPCAMRVFAALEGKGECPLTIREGRQFVTTQYSNKISALPDEETPIGGDPILEWKELWFRYEKALPDVLKGTQGAVYAGETLAILGGNGAGKSTLLKALAGLITPYRGEIKICGKKQGQYKRGSLYRNLISVLPQDPQTLFLSKTVREDLVQLCLAMDFSAEEQENRIAALAKRLKLEAVLDRHPYDISGGEQQKVALAMVLLRQPKLLLLDEPTKGIDASAKRELAELLAELKREGLTVVMVTHDVEFAAANADRCALFFDGEILSVSEPRSFFAENHFYTTAANRMVRGYFEQVVSAEDIVALCRQNKAGDAQ